MILTIVLVAATAVGVYLFVRNNKNKVQKLEDAIDEIKRKLTGS